MIFDVVHGGMSYDPAGVIRATHDHLAWVLLACAVSFVGAYMQYFGAIRQGFRDSTHSIPLIGNLWFFAHDTTFIVNYRHWFGEVDFWMMRPFWFALAAFALCECIVIYQILRFSRTTLFPGASLWQACLAYAGLQAFAYGLFWWYISMIHDPFYLLCFATTAVLAPLLNIPMMRARGSRRGFSPFMVWGFVILDVGFWAWMLLIDPYFRQPMFALVAIGNVGIAVAGLREFYRLPAWSGHGVPQHDNRREASVECTYPIGG